MASGVHGAPNSLCPHMWNFSQGRLRGKDLAWETAAASGHKSRKMTGRPQCLRLELQGLPFTGAGNRAAAPGQMAHSRAVWPQQQWH